MNKIDKYLRRFAYKIETSKTKESRYYTIGDLIVRVSNHIGKNSSGNISIIIDRNNYILYVPSTNKVSLISYEECKTLIRGIVLHASLFLVGDSTYQKSLVKENEELKLQISNLKQKINIQERQLISKKKPNDTSIKVIRAILINLEKCKKKKIKIKYGSCEFQTLPDSTIYEIWKDPEIRKYVKELKINLIWN